MVYLATSEEWQHQSALLLQARPTTARITTKYNIPNLDAPKYQKTKKRKRDGEEEAKDDAPRVPRAKLVLKTYDPESGVVLKFRTDRAADVGRLIGGLGRLGRHMAALPEKAEAQDTVMEDATIADQAPGTGASTAAKDVRPTAPDGKTQLGPAGGGGKKKKKGKK